MPLVYKSRVFSVEEGRRRFPNGQERDVVIVRHAPVAVIIPLTDDGRVVLVQQYRAPIDRQTWEVPAGGMNAGESPEDAARRECEEETGLVPDVLERLGEWYPTPGYCDELMVFFKASTLRPPAPDSTHKADEDEDIETRIVTVEEARSMVARGEIVDLKTAYALTWL